MTTFLLNSPVLPNTGSYRLDGPLPEEEACWLAGQDLVSAVGHASTAAWLSRVLGIDVPVNRTGIHMQPGDRALVFRLHGRRAEGAILDVDELARTPQQFCLLTRTA